MYNDAKNAEVRPMKPTNGIGAMPVHNSNIPFRAIAIDIRDASKSHDDYANNIITLTREAVMVFEEQLRNLGDQIGQIDQEIEMMTARKESISQQEKFIWAQIERLKRIEG